jgi:hypothetical protein
MRQYVWIVVGLALLLCAAGQAKADMIIINASGTSLNPIAPSADSITLDAASNTYNVTLPAIVGIQPGHLDFGNSGPLTQDIPFSLSENVTLNGDTRTVTITGDDNVTVTADTFTLNASKTDFPVAGLTLTTQPYTATGTFVGQQIDFTLEGLITVPEPGTLTLLGVGALSLAGFCLRRRQSKVAA